MTADHTGDQLHELLTEKFGRPFRYEEAASQYADDFDNFQQTFAATVNAHDYHHGPVDDDPFVSRYVAERYDDDAVDALVSLRDYLDDEDAWFLSRSFRRDADHSTYVDAVPELDDDTFDTLYDSGLLSPHGGISIITSDGWWAIYAATGEDVYMTPETTGFGAKDIVDAVRE